MIGGLAAGRSGRPDRRSIRSEDIFKQLTSVNLTAFCDQCEANRQGMVIVDNVIFEK